MFANTDIVLVPDLGSDLLRTFAINAADSKLRELTPFAVPAGSGPRHGTFYTPNCKPAQVKCAAAKKDNTYFFLVSELANTVSSYKVTYGKDGLGFTLVDSSGIYGNMTAPTGASAAEGILSVRKILSLSNVRTTNRSLSPTTNTSTHPAAMPPSSLFPIQTLPTQPRSHLIPSKHGALSLVPESCHSKLPIQLVVLPLVNSASTLKVISPLLVFKPLVVL
jgi:hypothetical protein